MRNRSTAFQNFCLLKIISHLWRTCLHVSPSARNGHCRPALMKVLPYLPIPWVSSSGAMATPIVLKLQTQALWLH